MEEFIANFESNISEEFRGSGIVYAGSSPIRGSDFGLLLGRKDGYGRYYQIVDFVKKEVVEEGYGLVEEAIIAGIGYFGKRSDNHESI